MEYIESKAGSYPATEGLLKLLGVLFSSGMAPSNLGSNTRTIPGCSPYIEYVVEFVLPRAMGTKSKGTSSLYFFTSADRSRLLTRALEVVNAVLIRYSFPEKEGGKTQVVPSLIAENVPQDMMFAERKMTTESTDINNTETITKPKSLALVHDDIYLKDGTTSQTLYADFEAPNVLSQAGGGDQTAIPSKSKSPGFFILSDMLSSDGSLLDILLQILQICSVEYDGSNGNNQLSSAQSLSLFGEIQPQHSTAKAARDFVLDHKKSGLSAVSISSIPAQFIENFLSPLFKQNTQNVPETAQSAVHCEDEVMWKEHCILLVLRILCATAGRNKDFNHRVNASQFASRVVPVLSFRHKEYASAVPLEVRNIQVDSLSKLITKDQSFLSFLAFYVGYLPLSLSNECSIATSALSIIKYIQENALPIDYTRYISGIGAKDKDKIAVSFATRLSMISNAKDNIDHLKIGEAILDQICLHWGKSMVSDQSLHHIIMGFSSRSLAEKRDFLWQSFQGVDVELCECNNVLDTIIELLLDVNFILDPESSFAASKCFEILFHLCNNEDEVFQVTKLCVTAKLRRLSFWQSQMLRFLGKESADTESILSTILNISPIQRLFNKDEESIVSRDSNLIHSTSWILKGVAQEFHALMGHGVNHNVVSSGDTTILSCTSPQPTKCRELLKFLFAEPNSVVTNTLLTLPLEKPRLASFLLGGASYQTIIDAATCEMEEPKDICRGYQLVNIDKVKRLLKSKKNVDLKINQKDQDHAIEWAEKWNSYTRFSCASSHLCQSWYFLSQTAFIFCQTSNEFDVGLASDVLKWTLHRLNPNGLSRGDQSNNAIVAYEASTQFESPNAYHLSILCPTLVEQIVSSNAPMSEDNYQQIFLQLLGAISSCRASTEIEEALDNKRAAELCCAVVALLESESFKSVNLLSGPFSQQQQLYAEAKHVVTYLGKLSVQNVIQMPIQGPSDPKYVSYMARAALASILSWFDRVETSSSSSGYGQFLLHLFPSSSSNDDFIPTCMSLLKAFDEDIVDLLELLASISCGTELLTNCGIGKILVSISQNFVDDAQTNNVTTHTYGSVGVEVPKFLITHFSLFNAMLSSNIPQKVRTSLVSDLLIFLQIHSSNLESLLLGFPKNHTLVLNVVSTFCGISSYEDEARTNMALHHRHYDWFRKLESHMINLATHLANFPLPPKYLSKLPPGLRSAKATCNRHYDNSRELSEKCWWDAVDAENENDFVLPEPVMNGYQIGGSGQGQRNAWSTSRYEAGIAASQFLDKCLSYIMNLSSHNQEIPIDFVSLGSSICQYSHTFQVSLNQSCCNY